jgi:hypothetical protein
MQELIRHIYLGMIKIKISFGMAFEEDEAMAF